MSTPTLPPAAPTPVCVLGLTRAQVAAWHDGTLSSDEARQLEAHVAGCPACAAHLTDFEQAERLVRTERVPEPDERLWRMVRARRTARTSGTASRRALGGVGAIAAVLLLAVGFAQLFRTIGARPSGTPAPTATLSVAPSPSPSPTGTPAITTGPQLAWRPVTLPPGMTRLQDGDGFAPSPVNGETAFACFAPSGRALQFWVTHDAGQHWTQLALPAGVTDGTCEVVPDANRPEVLALGVGPVGAPPNINQFYITGDGATSWHALPHGTTISALATYRGHGMSATYAILASATSDSATASQLQVSRDEYTTWQPVDFGASSSEGPIGLWMQPESGELLVETEANNTATLYASLYGRTTWKVLASAPGSVTIVVSQPTPGMPYHVCRAAAAPDSAGTTTLECNLNILLGGTFPAQLTARPPLPVAGGPQTFQYYYYAHLTTDGTLLALYPTTATNTNAFTLYRLAPDAAGWQNIGPVPEFHLLDTPTLTAANAEGDLLWALPLNGMQLDPQGRIFVAQFP